MQQNELPRMGHELNTSLTADADCLAEVQAVLARHGKAERFGVTLLHKHFDLAEDERLVEVVDADNRTLTTKPMKADELPSAEASAWGFDDEGKPKPLLWCYDKLTAHG